MKIHLWCDPCFDETETYVEGETTPAVAIGGKGGRTLELCERHRKELLEPLMALLGEKGALPGATPPMPRVPARPAAAKPAGTPAASPSDKSWDCPICGETLARTSAVGHVWGVHRKGEERTAVPKECPECDWKPPEGKNPELAMPIHRSRMHGVSQLDEALAGVVA